MVNIPADVLAHLLSQRIERWADSGRALDAAWADDGVRRVMRFGTRYRVQAVVPCALFGCVCAGAVIAELAGIPLGFWLRMGYAFFMFPVFLVSIWHTVGVCFMTVILSDTGITVGGGPFGDDTREWSQVFRVKYSTTWSKFVVEDAAGRCLRIPAQMDGLRTLCDFFLTCVPTTAIDPSVPMAMAKLI